MNAVAIKLNELSELFINTPIGRMNYFAFLLVLFATLKSKLIKIEKIWWTITHTKKVSQLVTNKDLNRKFIAGPGGDESVRSHSTRRANYHGF